MKKIIIEVESGEENDKIENHIKKFVSENFQDYKSAKITIEGEICECGCSKEETHCHIDNESWCRIHPECKKFKLAK